MKEGCNSKDEGATTVQLDQHALMLAYTREGAAQVRELVEPCRRARRPYTVVAADFDSSIELERYNIKTILLELMSSRKNSER